MYNSFLHQKHQDSCQIMHEKQEKSFKILKIQAKTREKLIQKYKSRIATKISDLSDHPLSLLPKSKARSEIRVNGKFFRMKPKDSRDRINDAIKQNSIFDSVPLTLNKLDLRPRKRQLELNGDMKFTPRDRFERVAEQLNKELSVFQGLSELFKNEKKLCFKTVEEVALNAKRSIKQKSVLNFLYDEKGSMDDGDESINLGNAALDVMEKWRFSRRKQDGLLKDLSF